MDGRYKPTLAAPGGEDPNFITSVDNSPGNPPAATCVTASSPFQGTSMATPAVAGSALNIRQYFVDGFYPEGSAGGDPLAPSAALVKGMLIASTADMAAGDIPNNNEGWGRILLDNSLYFAGDTRELMAEEVGPGLGTGGLYSKDFTLDGNEPLVVSAVWTDYPATSGGGTRLINDLDLLVTAPGGAQYKGNVFSGGFSTTGGSHDRLNVEEGVRVNNPALGAWRVEVRGYNVPQGPQPFALVINGRFAAWPTDPGSVAAALPAPERAFVRVFPNPMRETTSLHYAIPVGYEGPVELLIVDVQGRAVRTLVRKGQTTGDYRVTWEGLDQTGHDVADGVYFARLTAGAHTAGAKIILRR